MADMIPCKRCGHYDIVCDQEMDQLREEIADLEELLKWYAGIPVSGNDANDIFHEDISIPAREYLAGLSKPKNVPARCSSEQQEKPPANPEVPGTTGADHVHMWSGVSATAICIGCLAPRYPGANFWPKCANCGKEIYVDHDCGKTTQP